ncbi:hypothetical protein Chor_005082 [Crotalus horridus]
MAPFPKLVLLFSGKRKSGKDFVAEEIQSRLGLDVCTILRLSGPLKEQYAKIVSDTRRSSDVEWFRDVYGDLVQVVRVVATEEIRRRRKWVFVAGIDDAESECGLDQGVPFDWVITNDGDELSLEAQLEKLLLFIQTKL